MQASFQGLIGAVEIPDLLTFINLGRRTGLTELTRSDQSTRIFFQKGNPVFATSDKPGLRLGDLLVRMGRITARDLDRCVSRHRVGGPHLGQVFVSEGLITEGDLSPLLKVQVSEVIFDTFTWVQGSFAFYDDVFPPQDAVTLEMDLQNLLMEGVRRIDERGRLAEVFPDLDAVVEVFGNRESLRQSLTLTPEEWRLLFLVDGRRSLREVCQLAGNPDELASLEVLGRLFSANLVGFAALRLAAAPSPTPLPAEMITAASISRLVMPPSESPPLLASTPAQSKTSPPSPAPAPQAPLPPSPPPPRLPAEAQSPAEPRARNDADVVVSRKAVLYSSQTMALWARLLLQREGQSRSFPLSMESQTLGRSPKNNIVISDSVVSTFHARIDLTRDGFKIFDLTSTNGTYVNGKKIQSAVLKPRDEIQVGAVKLVYLEE